DAGADKNTTDKDGCNALHAAAFSPSEHAPRVVQTLLDAGVDKDATNNDGWTGLHLAALNESKHAPQVIKTLIDNSVDKNATTKNGWTALHLAAQNESEHAPQVIKILIDNGVDKNATDNDGWTALFIAKAWNRQRVIQLLESNKALRQQIELTQQQPKTLLSTDQNLGGQRISKNESDDDDDEKDDVKESSDTQSHIVELFGGLTNLSALCQAVWSNNEAQALRALRDPNVAVNEKCTEQEATALHLAAFYGNARISQTLLDAGVDKDATDDVGRTALHLAAQNKSKHAPQVVKILLDEGVDKDASQKDGWTALHAAARYNSSEHAPRVVQALLDAGVDTDAVDNSGKTALDIAKARNKQRIIELLE
ncbi:MAG: ankyrin repeat domain-containing protein, partial [Myxococcota bacterium]